MNLEKQRLEKKKKQLVERSFFYLNEVKKTGFLFTDEGINVFEADKVLEKEFEEKRIQTKLLTQHLNMSKSYYDQRLAFLKECEESHQMQCEDLHSQLTSLKSITSDLNEKHKRLKRSYKSSARLQKVSDQNELKIFKYSQTLQHFSVYMQRTQNQEFLKCHKKIEILLKKIQNLELAATDFSDDAQQDPRKTMPYVRSATPNRLSNPIL